MILKLVWFSGSIGSPEKERPGSLASSHQSLGRPTSRLHTPTQGMIQCRDNKTMMDELI